MTSGLWTVVVLAALVGAFVIDLVAQILDLRATGAPPPSRLADLYDRNAYHRSQAYSRTSIRAGLVESAVDLAAVLVFWSAGGFAWLDGVVRALGWPMPACGLVFLGVLTLGQVVLSLPFALWNTFVLEARYGFNRTTSRTFVLDGVKSLALLALLGAPFAALVIIFFERAGGHGWWLSWLLAATVTAVSQRLVPRYILPLFLRFEPLDPGSLRTAIEAWAEGVGLELAGLFVVDGSRRSTRANAFVSGFGKSRRIALFDTLVDQLEDDETVAVLAHEVAHDRLGHIFKGTVLVIVHLGWMFLLLGLVLAEDALFAAFGVLPSVYAGLVFFALLARPAELLLGAFFGAVSRRYEHQADAFAAATAGRGSMVRALLRLGRDNLVNLTPHPFRVALYDSHPPLAHRVAALEAEG